MRIISGLFRGKKILEPKDKNTRPLRDLTKESIFNIIVHSNKLNINLKNSYILDLFSGVGSFGIECLSRGVKSVTFIENYKEVLSILERNLYNLKNIKNYKILKKDIFKDNLELNFKNKFDIIFLDPPYKEKNLNIIFEKIEKLQILKEETIIILHRHKTEEDIFPLNYDIIEKKIYGISKIIFLKFLNK
tara:strand:- start:325 stop:894 length:570 start_codon:yes stop_codon:yes gene_type:complete